MRKEFNPSIIITLLLALLCFTLSAQENDNCIDFEALADETRFQGDDYPAGTILFNEDNVDVRIDSFTYEDGSKDIFRVEIYDLTDGFSDHPDNLRNAMWVSNAVVDLDFSDLGEGAVNFLSFEVLALGGEMNFGVNGNPVKVASKLIDFPTEIAPGVFLNFEDEIDDGFVQLEWVTATLTGEISTFTVGGQEFFIDHICHENSPPADETCIGFEGLEDGTLYNGDDYPVGTKLFTESNVSVSLDSFTYEDGSKELFFIDVIDLTNTNSNHPDNLGNALGLIFSNAVFDFSDLEESVNQVSFDVRAFEGQEMNIGVNGKPVKVAKRFIDFPEEIAPGVFLSFENLTDEPFAWTTVTLTGEISSLAVGGLEGFLIDHLCYQNLPQECNITNLVVDFNSECDEEGYFDATFSFEATTGFSSGFNLYLYDEFIKYYDSYSPDFIYEVENLAKAENQEIIISIQDKDNLDCILTKTLNAPFCETNNSECKISELIATVGDCDAAGRSLVYVSFKIEDAPSEEFKIYADDLEFGPFSYGEEFYTIGPFDRLGQTLEIKVRDGDCFESTSVKLLLNCGNQEECKIYEVTAEQKECDEESYYVLVDFEAQNPVSNSFYIKGNGTTYGTFKYEDRPIVLGPFSTDETVNEFVIIDTENLECQNFTEFDDTNCGNSDCKISELIAFPGDCTEEGKVSAYISFKIEDAPSEEFKIYANDLEFGPFGYGEEFYTIGPFFGEGQTLEIKVRDGDCFEYTSVKLPNCGEEEECKIYNVIAEAYECDEDGKVLVDVDFEIKNVPSAEFKIYANDQEFGPFEHGADFYTIGPFDGNGQTLEIKVRNNDCFEYTSVKLPNCEGNEECKIYDLSAKQIECDDQGNYSVKIDFEVKNPLSNSFIIRGNAKNYGTFKYDDLPIILGPFEANDTVDEFVVFDAESTDCKTDIEFEKTDCGNNEECNIVNITAEASECNDVGKYFIDVKIEVANPDDPNGFKIILFDQEFGPFDYGSDSYGFGPFEADGKTYEFKVKDLFEDGCYTYVSFTAPDCMTSEDCKIFNVTADAKECNDDGTFDVVIGFDFLDVGDDKFTVKGDGNFYGTYSYDELPITIHSLSGDGESLLEFVVADKSNPECNNFTILQAIACSAEVWPGDANSDNIANKFDVLNIGLAFESEGVKRQATNIEWTSMAGEDWEKSFKNGVNHKHADSNGDGVVNDDDLEAIIVNFGKTHGPVPPNNHPEGTEVDPPLFVDVENTPLTPGVEFEIPIILGTEGKDVEALYGIAFTINFDPEKVNASTIDVSFSESWMGTPNQNLISFDKKLIADGKMEVALTRNDRENTKGFGPIGTVTGIIIDDILGKVAFEITDLKAIDVEETPVKIYTPVHEGESSPTNGENPDSYLKIFPNPTDQFINVENKSDSELQRITLYNVVGKQIQVLYTPGNQFRINVSDLVPGMYMMQIQYEDEEFGKKIIVH